VIDRTNLMFIAMGVWIMMTIGFLLMVKNFFHKAKANEALVRSGFGETRVSFAGIMAIPTMHQLERLDLKTRKIHFDFTDLKTLDGAQIRIQASFYLEVEKTANSVLNVIRTLGVDQAVDDEALKDLFKEKFTEAMSLACGQYSIDDLNSKRQEFKQFFKDTSWVEIKGFHLQDMTLDKIEILNKEK
jgi:flotillin